MSWRRRQIRGPRHMAHSSMFSQVTAWMVALGVATAIGADEDRLFVDRSPFIADSANPVFKAAGEGAWDAAIRERGWILKEGDQWRMWYTGYDGTREGQKKLGLATSSDGVTWTRHPDNPLYDDDWVEDMQVVLHDGSYLMFAEGAGDIAQLLTSDDGVKWTRVGPLDVRQTSGEPLTPGPYGTPTAYFENGTWYLFYERGDAGIWLATSTDLKTFTNVQDAPVLALGPDEYDRVMIALNQIVKQGETYYALYHGTGTPQAPRLWATCVATSTDLVHWTKSPTNPLFPIAENKSSGILVHDGSAWRLYTMHGQVDLHRPAR
ncbi:MAG: glycosylase [Planctomycetaceae bacterium]|nr:glycosylase [Planctomycetaceae bacterium]